MTEVINENSDVKVEQEAKSANEGLAQKPVDNMLQKTEDTDKLSSDLSATIEAGFKKIQDNLEAQKTAEQDRIEQDQYFNRVMQENGFKTQDEFSERLKFGAEKLGLNTDQIREYSDTLGQVKTTELLLKASKVSAPDASIKTGSVKDANAMLTAEDYRNEFNKKLSNRHEFIKKDLSRDTSEKQWNELCNLKFKEMKAMGLDKFAPVAVTPFNLDN